MEKFTFWEENFLFSRTDFDHVSVWNDSLERNVWEIFVEFDDLVHSPVDLDKGSKHNQNISNGITNGLKMS